VLISVTLKVKLLYIEEDVLPHRVWGSVSWRGNEIIHFDPARPDVHLFVALLETGEVPNSSYNLA
jgi:hypothetical protein